MNPLTAIPPRLRGWLYLASFLTGIGLGAVQVGFQTADAGFPVWLKVTLSVYAFLAGALGLTAATHTPARGKLKITPGNTVGTAAITVVPDMTQFSKAIEDVLDDIERRRRRAE